jgi:protein SCO1/2
MRPRFAPSSYALAAILLIGAISVSGYLWQLGEVRQAQMTQAGSQSSGQTGVADVGGPFSLIDQDGVRRTDQDFHGRYMLVFFGFTYCPDVCPTTLAILSAALDEVGPAAENIVPVLITVDPARDTPEALKPYLSSFGSNFVGLTGTKEEIAAVADAYHAYYEIVETEGGDYTLNHSTAIYLMGPDGKFVNNYSLNMGPDEIAEDLKRLPPAKS